MKTVATKEARTVSAGRKPGVYSHRPASPLNETQTVIMRHILRPMGEPSESLTQDRDSASPDSVTRSENHPAAPSDAPGSSASKGHAAVHERIASKNSKEALQRQPEEEQEREEPLETEQVQAQFEEDEDDPEVPERIQPKPTAPRNAGLARPPSIGDEKAAPQVLIQRILRPGRAQAKLAVGPPDDQYEREADRVAEQVISKPNGVRHRQADAIQDEGHLREKPIADHITPLIHRQVEEEEPLRARASASGEPTDVDDEAEQKIQQTRGQGALLPNTVQRDMENGIDADFSDVRIHTDSSASDINRQINARAFTLGNDIYFASGEYSPTTERGNRLLAHELTHVVQQTAAAPRRQIQRVDGDSPPPETAGSADNGLVNRSSKTVTFATVQIPAFKGEAHRRLLYDQWDLKRSRNFTGSRPGNQQDVWKRGIATQQIETALRQKADASHFTPNSGSYLFSSPARPITHGVGRNHRPRGQRHYYIGTLTEIARASSAPAWNRRGSETTSMEVDHIVEMQLSGFPDTPRERVHSIDNMELLERRPNSESGTMIDADINQKVDSILADNAKKIILEYSIPGLETQSRRDRKRNLVRNNYDLIFEGYTARGGSRVGDASYWSKEQIERGEHLGPVTPASFSDLGEEGKAMVFPAEAGGVGKKFDWDGQTTTPSDAAERNWFKPFTMTSKRFWTDPTGQQNLWFGEFNLQIPDDDSTKFKPVTKTVFADKIPGTHLAGRISKQQVQRSAERLEVKGVSPVEVSSIDLENDRGFVISGEVGPTIPFLENANLNFRFDNGDLYVFRTFSATDLNIPRPFSISNSSLTVSINTANGLQIDGAVDFGIEHLGQGNIRGSVNALGEFGVAGEFNFDERLFGEGTNAQVRIAYENRQWSMGGTISIPSGKVPGVRSATINVDYSEAEGFAAQGNAELDVPGVESGTIRISHSEAEGFAIGGSFNLSADTPGIRGGSISADVREKEDRTGYSVSARGEAQPDIPGINSNLVIAYDDGAFTAEVTADYSRGMLSGQVHAGVTNRSVNPETGELSATAEENNPLVVFGGGQLTIRIAPWLQGAAGVRFAPNGEITVTGEIGLPGQLEIFPRREINRSIFNIAVQAPIFPGIVAEVGGGLGAVAGIGPGVIDQLSLGITYNPAREQDTTITGDAHLRVPADAGLRLSVRAGIGLGITGASATGGLEIGGTLGIEGAAEAGVHVDWTPRRGLDLTATVSVHAQPAFTFDISGYVSVRALGFSVYDQTWQLASFRFGSDYRFGIRLPIHYQEGQPFDISLDDVEFEVPDIDTNALLRGLISRIA